MKKTTLGAAIALTLGASILPATSAQAAVLNFDAGAKECVLGGTAPDSCTYGVTTTVGSYFSMDADGSGTVADSEKVAISQFNGITVDGVTTQLATGSHTGAVDGTESPDIDNPWEFFTNTGMHQTTSPISVVSNDGAGSVGLDFTGWSVTWNGIADIPMGGDAANFGLAGNTGVADMVCAVDCSDGDTYVLNYAAQVPLNDPSGFGGVPYTLYLTGTVTGTLPPPAVPVPAAVWLFGSGLLGLVGVARRRKVA